MPTRTVPEAELVPAPDAAGHSYDRDFYSWSLEQARLVREGHWNALDRENVAEEIESLGTRAIQQVWKARSACLLVHMLKWDHQPRAADPRSWTLSIEEQRDRRSEDVPRRQSRSQAAHRRSDRTRIP